MACNMFHMEPCGNQDLCLGIMPSTLNSNFASDFSALMLRPLARVIKSPNEKISSEEDPGIKIARICSSSKTICLSITFPCWSIEPFHNNSVNERCQKSEYAILYRAKRLKSAKYDTIITSGSKTGF